MIARILTFLRAFFKFFENLLPLTVRESQSRYLSIKFWNFRLKSEVEFVNNMTGLGAAPLGNSCMYDVTVVYMLLEAET